jgi:uncharacterized protein YkvS
MNKEDLKKFSAEELREIRKAINEVLKIKDEQTLIKNREQKAERELKFTNKVKIGDVIEFLFNKEKIKAVVENVSQKSVTVFIDEKKKYIKYCNILQIIETSKISQVA